MKNLAIGFSAAGLGAISGHADIAKPSVFEASTNDIGGNSVLAAPNKGVTEFGLITGAAGANAPRRRDLPMHHAL